MPSDDTTYLSHTIKRRIYCYKELAGARRAIAKGDAELKGEPDRYSEEHRNRDGGVLSLCSEEFPEECVAGYS